MSVYRVLVAHRGLRVGQVVELDNPVKGYVKEVRDAGPVSGDVGADSPVLDLPVRRRATSKAKVANVEDRAEPGGGSQDRED